MIEKIKNFTKKTITTILGIGIFLGLPIAYIYFFEGKPLPPYYEEIQYIKKHQPEFRILVADQTDLTLARPLYPTEGFGRNAFFVQSRRYKSEGIQMSLYVIDADCEKNSFELFPAVSHEEAQQKNLIRYYDGYGRPAMASDFFSISALGEDRYIYYTDSNFIKSFLD